MNDKEKTGGSAFPATWISDTGMTLRDWLAGMAMQGIISQLWFPNARNNPAAAKMFAENAYMVADEMLKVRKEIGE